MESDCDSLNYKFRNCLQSSSLKPEVCRTIEADLRSCSQSIKKDYCIDEVLALMNCVRNPDRNVCAKQFLSMRECNRQDGRHIVLTSEDNLEILPDKERFFLGRITEPIDVTPRSLSTLTGAVDSIKRVLHFKNFKENVKGYQWDYTLFRNAGK